MKEDRDSRLAFPVVSEAEFIRMARASPGSALRVQLSPPTSRRTRLLLMAPDDESVLVYLERPPAVVACLVATILHPANDDDFKGST
jgi:hypothetical protein